MDSESIGIIAMFVPHVLGGIFLGWRLLPASARGELREWFREDDDGGSRVPTPVRPRSGGGSALPLSDASPSTVRLREPGRLGDRLPGPARRPVHPPLPERVTEPIRR
jgi:hypothetical protein